MLRVESLPLRRQATTFARRLASRAVALRLPQTAGSLAFLSLFAFVPVATITLAVMAALPAFDAMRASLMGFVSTNFFVPAFAEALLRYVNQFAAKAASLSALGLTLFLLTAVTTLATIERTLNAIWQSRPRRGWAGRLGLYWALLTLAPPVLAISLAVESYVWAMAPALGLPWAQKLWGSALPWLLTWGALTVVYRVLPGARVRVSHAAAGAFVAATLLQVWKLVLGFFIARFPTYTVVYGAFAVLPVLLTWLYLLWMTVLAGALVASEARHWGRPWHGSALVPPAERYARARVILAELAEAAQGGVSWLPASRFGPLVDHDADALLELATLLESAGYLRRLVPPAMASGHLDIWDESWVLANSAADATPRALHEALWGGAPAADLDQPLTHAPQPVADPPKVASGPAPAPALIRTGSGR